MAIYYPTSDDLRQMNALLSQHLMDIKIKIDVFDDDNAYVGSIDCGVISANITIDSTSDVRRTASLELIPMSDVGTIIGESNLIWINRNIKVSVGLKSQRSGEYIWYKQGTYIIMNTSSAYDASTNTLSLQLSDWMAKLDGTRNGNLGQQTIEFPAYEEYDYWESGKKYSVGDQIILYDDATGKTNIYKCITENSDTVWTASHWSLVKEAINYGIQKYYYIKDAMTTAVSQLGRIKDYNIDWIGERKAFPYYTANWDFMEYRESTKIQAEDGNYYYQCFAIPHDLEFSSGDTVLGIITEMRDLYEGYECYFDLDNTFCCDLTPTGQDDPVILESEFFEDILISENSSLDFSEAKNIEEVWGECFDPDFYEDDPLRIVYANNVYTVNFDSYIDDSHKDYYNGDVVAFLVPTENNFAPSLKITNGTKSLDEIGIYDENYDTPLSGGVLEAGVVATLKIKKRYDTQLKKEKIVAYYMGSYQSHAMDVLTNGELGGDYTDTTYHETVKRYSERYFQLVYNCNDVHLTTIKDSPFVVQKIGEILEVYDNDNIQSVATAMETARQENYRNYRLTDSIQITIKLCPFIDVNWKVKYRKVFDNTIKEYLITNISHDLAGGTTSLKLTSYYPLYIETA